MEKCHLHCVQEELGIPVQQRPRGRGYRSLHHALYRPFPG
jgi:hypothetical protein